MIALYLFKRTLTRREARIIPYRGRKIGEGREKARRIISEWWNLFFEKIGTIETELVRRTWLGIPAPTRYELGIYAMGKRNNVTTMDLVYAQEHMAAHRLRNYDRFKSRPFIEQTSGCRIDNMPRAGNTGIQFRKSDSGQTNGTKRRAHGLSPPRDGVSLRGG